MHPDDPMYAYVMKHKRVETKKVILYSKAMKRVDKKFGQNVVYREKWTS